MSEQPEQLKLALPAAPTKKSSKSSGAALKSTRAPLSKQPPPDGTVLSVQEKQPPPTEPQTESYSYSSSSSSSYTPQSTTTASEDQTTMAESTTKSADFETMLAELEKVVGQLEGELKLEEALSLFERGLSLSKDCEQFLKAAQQKIEVLKRSANGSVQTEPFSEAADLLT
jgi:exodeoxyribonuclease VII small subunit